MKSLIVMMSVLAACGSCGVDTYPIGACPQGASVYNVDPTLTKIRFCSFSGDAPADGLCMQRSRTVVCLPLCDSSSSHCANGEQDLTYAGVCYCNVAL